MAIRIPDRQFVERLSGSSLVTARIFYRIPDHLNILQEYIWQELDLVPKYPELQKFLGFWERKIEGPLHSVEVVHVGLLTPSEIHFVQRTEFPVH